jgi:hypothetical protein
MRKRKMSALMMTAERVAEGMKVSQCARRPKTAITMAPKGSTFDWKLECAVCLGFFANNAKLYQPVYTPLIGVLTPDASFTADLVNEPVTGIDWMNEPRVFVRPRVSTSCVVSIDTPFAD